MDLVVDGMPVRTDVVPGSEDMCSVEVTVGGSRFVTEMHIWDFNLWLRGFNEIRQGEF